MAQNRILLNGALSKPFQPYQDNNQLITAVGWAPWWQEKAEDDPSWKDRDPVFSPATLDNTLTQQISTPFGTHTAGLWQQVPSVPGNSYEFSVEGQAWSSEDTTPGSQLEASDVNLQIGVDPTGGLDPNSPLVLWSGKFQPHSHWQTLHLEATAEATVITVYLRSAPSLPKRQQAVFWRQAELRAIGRHKRGVNIVGAGDTHITIEPERPNPGEPVTAIISSTRAYQFTELLVFRPDHKATAVIPRGRTLDGDRHVWRFEFKTDQDGLYEIRFAADRGARLLALRLLRVARDVQLVPSDKSRFSYRRVYVLLPPTADTKWLLAAARGSFAGRYTIGYSADDAGIGDLNSRHVLAVNPHHWPEVLTASWFQQNYPGVQFTAVIANQPEDLEVWLKEWTGIE